jgi:uncharacterized OsmC-like protein
VAKRFAFEASLDETGAIGAGGATVVLEEEWSAESLVLAALLRCSLTSLRYHARHAGLGDVRGSGSASGVITKREADGRYAFVEVDAQLDVEIVPEPPKDELTQLLARAERDCFVGASLTVKPTYRWRVNGADL